VESSSEKNKSSAQIPADSATDKTSEIDSK
jgi:hypothetical protein